MNDLIINKKGNSGYLIQGWSINYSGIDSDSYYNHDDITSMAFKPILTLMVDEVTVHSAGKKIMRLHSQLSAHGYDSDKMLAQELYHPQYPIYKNKADAIAQATAHLEKCRDQFMASYEKKADYYIKADRSHLSATGIKNRDYAINRMLDNIKLVKENGIRLIVVTSSDKQIFNL